MSLPKTCSLPNQYLETQEEEFFVGLPFWEIETKYKHLANVPVGTKGNDCLGCEPGSGPSPFIVVYNDGNKMGFIYPYVTVVGRKEEKSNVMRIETSGSFQYPNSMQKKPRKIGKVTVKVGGDVDQHAEAKDVRNATSEYKINYFTYEEMKALMDQFCCFNFGSFGNCGLPNYEDDITFDGYFYP